MKSEDGGLPIFKVNSKGEVDFNHDMGSEYTRKAFNYKDHYLDPLFQINGAVTRDNMGKFVVTKRPTVDDRGNIRTKGILEPIENQVGEQPRLEPKPEAKQEQPKAEDRQGEPQHHVGDTKQENGHTYRLNENHKWERVDEEEKEQEQPKAEETKPEAKPEEPTKTDGTTYNSNGYKISKAFPNIEVEPANSKLVEYDIYIEGSKNKKKNVEYLGGGWNKVVSTPYDNNPILYNEITKEAVTIMSKKGGMAVS